MLYIKPGFQITGPSRRMFAPMRWPTSPFRTEQRRDQFFSKSQMESYRSLGRFIADTVLGEPAAADKAAPTEALQPYWKHLSEYIVQYDKQAAVRPAG